MGGGNFPYATYTARSSSHSKNKPLPLPIRVNKVKVNHLHRGLFYMGFTLQGDVVKITAGFYSDDITWYSVTGNKFIQVLDIERELNHDIMNSQRYGDGSVDHIIRLLTWLSKALEENNLRIELTRGSFHWSPTSFSFNLLGFETNDPQIFKLLHPEGSGINGNYNRFGRKTLYLEKFGRPSTHMVLTYD